MGRSMALLVALWVAAVSAASAQGDLPELAYVKDGNLWLYDFVAKAERQVTKDGGYSSPSWTMDGASLVAVRERNVVLVDLLGARCTQLTHWGDVTAAAACPTKGMAYCARQRGNVEIWSLKVPSGADPQPIHDTRWAGQAVLAELGWNAAGTICKYILANEGGSVQGSLDRIGRVVGWDQHPDGVLWMECSWDGRQLVHATTTVDYAWHWTVTDTAFQDQRLVGASRSRVAAPAAGPVGALFSPDGRWIAAAEWSEPERGAYRYEVRLFGLDPPTAAVLVSDPVNAEGELAWRLKTPGPGATMDLAGAPVAHGLAWRPTATGPAAEYRRLWSAAGDLGDAIEFCRGSNETCAQPHAWDSGGTPFVPLRSVANWCGGDANSVGGKVDVGVPGHTARIVLGSANAIVDGRPVTLNAAPREVGGVTMVPLRFVAQALGGQVGYLKPGGPATGMPFPRVRLITQDGRCANLVLHGAPPSVVEAVVRQIPGVYGTDFWARVSVPYRGFVLATTVPKSKPGEPTEAEDILYRQRGDGWQLVEGCGWWNMDTPTRANLKQAGVPADVFERLYGRKVD